MAEVVEMLALARGYAAAVPADQAGYIAAGHEMLASYWDMGTSFVFGYVLSAVGGILFRRGAGPRRALGRAAGWLLLVANVVGLGTFLPGVAIVVSLFRSCCSGSGICASVGRSCGWSVASSPDRGRDQAGRGDGLAHCFGVGGIENHLAR